MNWHEKKQKTPTLHSDHGYQIQITAIKGRVTFCAQTPTREILGMPGTMQEAQQLCENHRNATE